MRKIGYLTEEGDVVLTDVSGFTLGLTGYNEAREDTQFIAEADNEDDITFRFFRNGNEVVVTGDIDGDEIEFWDTDGGHHTMVVADFTKKYKPGKESDYKYFDTDDEDSNEEAGDVVLYYTSTINESDDNEFDPNYIGRYVAKNAQGFGSMELRNSKALRAYRMAPSVKGDHVRVNDKGGGTWTITMNLHVRIPDISGGPTADFILTINGTNCEGRTGQVSMDLQPTGAAKKYCKGKSTKFSWNSVAKGNMPSGNIQAKELELLAKVFDTNNGKIGAYLRSQGN